MEKELDEVDRDRYHFGPPFELILMIVGLTFPQNLLAEKAMNRRKLTIHGNTLYLMNRGIIIREDQDDYSVDCHYRGMPFVHDLMTGFETGFETGLFGNLVDKWE